MRLKPLVTGLLCLYSLTNFAQDKSTAKFGKITADDFKQTLYPIDSNANAVVIADIGSTKFVGNSKNWFSLQFNKYKRIHLLNKNGYDAASVSIGIYTNGHDEEALNSLKAVTYNLENGKVIETKLDKATVFQDKINSNLIIKKFTFPNIREGSIIEYQYEILSDFTFNLQPWEFQESNPTLWSEYTVSIPEFFGYTTLMQGYQSFYINTQKNSTDYYNVSETGGTGPTERVSFSAGITEYRWVMKDVPALREESYTSTVNNHLDRIEFQLSEYKHPLSPRTIMPTWPQAAASLLKDEDFGYSLNRDNGWLNDVMPEATQNAKNDIDKARNIFSYLRDHMTCTDHDRKYLEKPLKQVLKARNGNVAEINLLLTAMLQKAGLHADPVLISTRSHGYVYAIYPLLQRFNYVISRVEVDGSYYYLDASLPGMGFGRLGSDSYNGQARVIDKFGTAVSLPADSLLEAKLSSIIIINDEKGNLTGSMKQTPGFYESYRLRNQVKEKGKAQLFADIKKGFNADIELSNTMIDSLDKYDDPIQISYDFNVKTDKEDIMYINPMFSEAWKENPFKSAERLYPVEMPYTIDETYLLKIDIPEGYKIDELPKPIMVKLDENNDGFFEYVLAETDGSISLRSRVCLRRAFYMPEEYQTLREFFNLVVKKHNEQIVFKKKK